MDVLVDVWEHDLFGKIKAKARVKNCRETVNDLDWIAKIFISYDLMTEISAIRTWGSGCRCHEAERLAAKCFAVECKEQGIRMPEVVDKLDSVFLAWTEFSVACPAEHQAQSQELSQELESRGLVLGFI